MLAFLMATTLSFQDFIFVDGRKRRQCHYRDDTVLILRDQYKKCPQVLKL